MNEQTFVFSLRSCAPRTEHMFFSPSRFPHFGPVKPAAAPAQGPILARPATFSPCPVDYTSGGPRWLSGRNLAAAFSTIPIISIFGIVLPPTRLKSSVFKASSVSVAPLQQTRPALILCTKTKFWRSGSTWHRLRRDLFRPRKHSFFLLK